MLKLKSSVKTESGLSARAASTFVQYTNRYICDIFIKYDDVVADAKSIMGILALGVAADGDIEITFDGVDERVAKESIQTMLDSIITQL